MKIQLPAQFLLFTALLVILNIIQAAVTPLIFDEAYYWYFAENLAWGYFDHPPMVAWMIRAGSLLFPGELGVRFISCLLSGATALFLWLTIDHKNKADYVPHFFILLFSMVLLNAYGFLTLPDTPLLFFTAVFLWSYKRFLAKPDYLHGIGLGLVMAALMYSKYHAFLVIFFVAISNIKLLRSRYAWVAIGVAVVAYLPHLYWLYDNGFVTIKYHLFDRPNRAYEFADFTLGYLVNLIAIFGLTFPWIYYTLFKSIRAKDPFNKSLVYLVFGILAFFLISSFSRRVQTQWIIVICIPAMLTVFPYLMTHAKIRRALIYSGLANGIILLFLRIGLVYEPLFPVVYETHGNKEWIAAVDKAADGLTVVFENSYRRAPMYSFYSGKPSFSLNNIMYRRNQYSIDNSESRVRDQPVYMVYSYSVPSADAIPTLKGDTLYGKPMDYFKPYRKLRVEVDQRNGKEVLFTVDNPYERNIPLEELEFGSAFLNGYKQILETRKINAEPVVVGSRRIRANSQLQFRAEIPEATSRETEYYKITISENGLYWGLNGQAETLDDGI